MKKVCILWLAILSLAGCSKDSNRNNDRDAPLVTVSTPVNNQSFAAGSSMNVAGTISDAGKIVQVHFHFSSLETGQLILDVHRYPGSGAYTISESIQIPGTGEYRLQVIARDNAGNEGRQTIVVNGN